MLNIGPDDREFKYFDVASMFESPSLKRVVLRFVFACDVPLRVLGPIFITVDGHGM